MILKKEEKEMMSFDAFSTTASFSIVCDIFSFVHAFALTVDLNINEMKILSSPKSFPPKP